MNKLSFCRIASHVTDANTRSIIGTLVVHHLLIKVTQYSSFSVNCCLDKVWFLSFLLSCVICFKNNATMWLKIWFL